ncbi:hypothetical protein LCGC14_1472720 [marine sediment metagenome]|uniref:Uncharacterized protein n=1 Tax=marine sediment metagenome TaxID=412755 RepID=A0A0F9JBW5_9ZZZZ
MKCAFCHVDGANNITNIELDIGFRVGDLARETMGIDKMKTIKPIAISVSSLYLCFDCSYKLGNNLFNIQTNQIMKELKKSLKNTWLKQMILNALETKEK